MNLPIPYSPSLSILNIPNYYQKYNLNHNIKKYKKIKKTVYNTPSEITLNLNNSISNSPINIFGINLEFDDIIILVILFFLYTEGVKDQILYIILIMLLLS